MALAATGALVKCIEKKEEGADGDNTTENQRISPFLHVDALDQAKNNYFFNSGNVRKSRVCTGKIPRYHGKTIGNVVEASLKALEILPLGC